MDVLHSLRPASRGAHTQLMRATYFLTLWNGFRYMPGKYVLNLSLELAYGAPSLQRICPFVFNDIGSYYPALPSNYTSFLRSEGRECIFIAGTTSYNTAVLIASIPSFPSGPRILRKVRGAPMTRLHLTRGLFSRGSFACCY